MKARQFVVILFFIWPFSNFTALAQNNLAAQKEALDVIDEFAKNLCNSVEARGRGENSELSGEAKAELTGVISRLADLGVEGAAKYQTTEYEGVLQTDLAATLSTQTNCRLEVWRDLKDKLIPSAPESPPTPTACVPELFAPANMALLRQHRLDNGKIESNWMFGWRACPQASRYHLFVIGPSALNPLINDDSITSAVYDFRRIDNGATQLEGWTWKVQAFVDGKWGTWSEERKFNIDIPR